MHSRFDDFQPSANLAVDPATYELENQALARDGRLDRALAELAPWAGHDLLDIGCGNGFWLPGYAATARSVIGVEPDPVLAEAARRRCRDWPGIEIRAGSAEHLPCADASIDVAHARFAYFFGEGASAGLAEVCRVLRPGGVLAVVDNDAGGGDLAELLALGDQGNAAIDLDRTAAWWAEQGAVRHRVEAGWWAASAAEMERILRLEFPGDVVDRFAAGRPLTERISYSMAVYIMRV